MKRKFELTEKEIKEAIAVYVVNTMGVNINGKDVILNVEKNRGQFDTEGWGHTVTATVSEAA